MSTFADAPRFSEPEDNWPKDLVKIVGTYAPDEAVVFLYPREEHGFVEFADIDACTYWIEADLEQFKNSEPDIAGIRIYTMPEGGGQYREIKDPGERLLKAADQFLRDDHERWAKLRNWLWENGDRIYLGKEAA